jgi:hypothetical protein
MLTVAVSGADHAPKLAQVEEIVGRHHYRQGTDSRLFADFLHRDEADLAVVNLNCIAGVHAQILEPCPQRS